ncbi:MAG: hypothetical protein BJ554DRAFT_7499 [Olpidium bornovanus]|uniref:Uncharacterized protein n=1 Tax=Olpidium bornovanus TaxID=278681 RepID=A0A8H7ZW38_9FUNG|nr:MAG: hypothetical protein BJ554DRAFT_7499 [Olpidium bornovanus]
MWSSKQSRATGARACHVSLRYKRMVTSGWRVMCRVKPPAARFGAASSDGWQLQRVVRPEEHFAARLRTGDACGRVVLMSLIEVELLARLLRKLPGSQDAKVYGAYKPVGQKVWPMVEELPRDAGEQIKRARMEPWLGPAESIGHQFTEETLARLRVGGDGLLSEAEIAVLRSMIRPLGRAFAFTDDEIGLVDPLIVAPMVIFTTAHVSWKLKPLPIPRACYDKLLELLQARIARRVLEPAQGPDANRWFTVPKKDGSFRFIQDLRPTLSRLGTPALVLRLRPIPAGTEIARAHGDADAVGPASIERRRYGGDELGLGRTRSKPGAQLPEAEWSIH